MYLTTVPMDHKTFSSSYPRWTDSYWVHTRVMNLFGELGRGDTSRSNGGILYRVEPDFSRVLVQSGDRPLDPALASVDLTPTLRAYHEGTEVILRVKVNAAKTVNVVNNGIKTRSRSVIGPEAFPSWIEALLGPSVRVDAVHIANAATEKQRKVPVATVTTDVHCTVLDPVGFCIVLQSGIGKAKSFGCGMVSPRLKE